MTDMQNQQPEEVTTVVAKECTHQSAVPETEETTVQNGISINDTTTTTTTTIIIEQQEEITEIIDTTTTTPSAVLIKKPRADSKLILQNMEEVLKSVKKKHRAKHKRKRELKKLALLEAAAAEKVQDTSMGKRHKKKPLQVAALENATATSTHNNSSILQHFSRTPKKQQTQSDNHILINDSHDDIIEMLDPDINTGAAAAEIEMEADVAEPKRKTNAFEVMMNARNKSIGGNSPGKDASLVLEEISITTTTGTGTSTSRNAAQLKCKELLQNWAERKGAGKRKLEEEARAAYVEQELENRAKRYVLTYLHTNN